MKNIFKNEKILWALIIATQIFFFAYSQIHHQTKTADSDEYIFQAANILHYGVIYSGDYTVEPKDLSLYGRRTPGYPAFLIVTLLFLKSDFFTLLIQCGLSVFNIFLGYILLKRISIVPPKTYWYLLFFLFFPSQFIYGTVYMSEIFFQTSILLCLYTLFHFEQKGQIKNLYLHHFLMALTYIIKPIAMFLWVGCHIYGIIAHNRRGIAKHQIILALFHVLVLSSFAIKNYYYTGIAEFSGISRKLMINYSLPAAIHQYENAEFAQQRIRTFQESIRGETYAKQVVETDNFIRKEISVHTFSFIAVQSFGIIRFFLETGRWDLALWLNGYQNADHLPSLQKIYAVDGWKGVYKELSAPSPFFLLYYIGVVLAVLCLFYLFGRSWFSRSLTKSHKWLLLCLVMYFAFLTGPSASARFRLPVYPVIVILAVSGLTKMPKGTPLLVP